MEDRCSTREQFLVCWWNAADRGRHAKRYPHTPNSAPPLPCGELPSDVGPAIPPPHFCQGSRSSPAAGAGRLPSGATHCSQGPPACRHSSSNPGSGQTRPAWPRAPPRRDRRHGPHHPHNRTPGPRPGLRRSGVCGGGHTGPWPGRPGLIRVVVSRPTVLHLGTRASTARGPWHLLRAGRCTSCARAVAPPARGPSALAVTLTIAPQRSACKSATLAAKLPAGLRLHRHFVFGPDRAGSPSPLQRLSPLQTAPVAPAREPIRAHTVLTRTTSSAKRSHV
jgi:hypothetical protein